MTTDKLVIQKTTLPCGCVITIERTVASFTETIDTSLVHDFHPELTFCPLHGAAESWREKCLDVTIALKDIADGLNSYVGNLTDTINRKGEPHGYEQSS